MITNVTRRDFLRTTGAAGVGLAAMGLTRSTWANSNSKVRVLVVGVVGTIGAADAAQARPTARARRRRGGRARRARGGEGERGARARGEARARAQGGGSCETPAASLILVVGGLPGLARRRR